MIEINDNWNCCGCEACVQACPRNCISFEEDAEGFRYSFVDKSNCVDCKICEKVCPILNQYEERNPLEVYAAKNKDENDLLSSSSGGLFIVLANKIIKDGGVVFGAKFDEHWNVVHSFSETADGVRAFMGSKYVQSRIGNSYVEARGFLLKGRKVLFTGTPCQIAGLKKYLQRDYDNLLTIDVICHGVPSPKVWQKYLECEKKKARNIVAIRRPLEKVLFCSFLNPLPLIKGIRFRDKSNGWTKFHFVLVFAEAPADGKQSSVPSSYTVDEVFYDNNYMKAFLKNLILRPSCHRCAAKSGRSHSDVTIADFWGIQRVLPQMDDDRGTGLVFVNTEKGRNYLDYSRVNYQAVKIEEALKDNQMWNISVNPHPGRQVFFDKLNKKKNVVLLIEKTLTPRSTRVQRIKTSVAKVIGPRAMSVINKLRDKK